MKEYQEKRWRKGRKLNEGGGGGEVEEKPALQQASVLLLILTHKHVLYVEAHTLYSVQSTCQISFMFLRLFCLCHEHNSSETLHGVKSSFVRL